MRSPEFRSPEYAPELRGHSPELDPSDPTFGIPRTTIVGGPDELDDISREYRFIIVPSGGPSDKMVPYDATIKTLARIPGDRYGRLFTATVCLAVVDLTFQETQVAGYYDTRSHSGQWTEGEWQLDLRPKQQ